MDLAFCPSAPSGYFTLVAIVVAFGVGVAVRHYFAAQAKAKIAELEDAVKRLRGE